MNAARVPVLMYHRIGEAHNSWERKYCVSSKNFRAQMHRLEQSGWRAIAIRDFFAWLDGGITLPEKSFLITFDDGFAGVHTYAAPVLEELAWTAAIFLVTELIGGRDVWCERHNPGGATYPLMDRHQIDELRRRGFAFFSHTKTHADLTTLDAQKLTDELAGSREQLQQQFGDPVDYLAYPYGRYDETVIQAAKQAGYQAAFSVQPGFNRESVDRFRLRRIDVFGTDSPAALCRKMTLGSNDGSIVAGARYFARQLKTQLGLH